MSLLKKAVSKAAAAPATQKSKGTVWRISALAKPEESAVLQEAVTKLQQLHGEVKSRETEMGMLKSTLKEFANAQLVQHVASHESMPEPALKVVCDSGASVTFVVQDRMKQQSVSDEQLVQLNGLVGEDVASRMVVTATDFSLNSDLLENEEIADVVGNALEAAVAELVAKNLCSQEIAESLVECTVSRRFKHGLLDRLTEFTGKDVSRVESVLDVMGGSVVRYVKV